MLTRLRRRLLGATPSTETALTTVLAEHPAPVENVPDEEMDRYTRYHTSKAWGR